MARIPFEISEETKMMFDERLERYSKIMPKGMKINSSFVLRNFISFVITMDDEELGKFLDVSMNGNEILENFKKLESDYKEKGVIKEGYELEKLDFKTSYGLLTKLENGEINEKDFQTEIENYKMKNFVIESMKKARERYFGDIRKTEK